MENQKCYHMTRFLKDIIKKEDENGFRGLKPIVGENSMHVNDTKNENIGISYSLGLEGIITTNAMFRARYQYDLLENQTDRDVTLDDMFAQDVRSQEDKTLGDSVYLVFDETEEIRSENEERDIADPKTKSAIDISKIRGIVLRNNKTGQIKYDRKSILRYAINNTQIEDILKNLSTDDRPFMNMEGYAKTQFSFRDYVQRFFQEVSKESKTQEFDSDDWQLQEIDVNELLEMIEKDKINNDNKLDDREVIDDRYMEQRDKKIAEAIVNEKQDKVLSPVLEGFCGKDVSQLDMSNLSPENFKRLTFDSETIFSPEQIEKFHPEELIVQGKKFSQYMEKLYEEGVDGRGTSIALLDTPFDSSVEEFGDRVAQHIVFERKEGENAVSCREYVEDDDDGFHGKTTASLAVGEQCGVAPKANIYLFGAGNNISWKEAKDAMLKYIRDNNIKLDIISISADLETTKEGEEILDKLDEEGCAIIDSSKFWKDFSWGRTNENGEIVLDEMMKVLSNTEHDENSRAGKVIKNMPNTVILPCTGRTSLQIGNDKVYKYNGSLCGASFAIPQVAGLFLLARQKDPSIRYDEFIEIVKNPERLNSEGLMYLDVREVMEKVDRRAKTKREISTRDLGIQTLDEQNNTSEKIRVEEGLKQLRTLEVEREAGKEN